VTPGPHERSQQDPTISRRQLLLASGAGALFVIRPSQAGARRVARAVTGEATGDVVLGWNEAFLQGVRDSRLGPPMVSRALAVAHTCMYDAWAAYDRTAVGTQLGGHLRRPAGERSLAHKVTATSYAAYRAALDLFPWDKASVFDPLMASLGLDPGDTSTDPSKAAGIGNLAAQAVLEFRHRDGANQLGDEPGGTPGVPYSDYTGFKPVNAPMDVRLPFDPATVIDPSQWQPLRFLDGTGAVVTQPFVGAHWQRVEPFALESTSALRSPTGPAVVGSHAFQAQAAELLELSAGLTDTHKAIAEYWADGPRSELPPGHWNLFAQWVARRDRHGSGERDLDRGVKLFFALTNAIFDAGICAWDNKCAFASVRPMTAIRWLFQGQRVRAWGGPGRGTQLIAGEEWFPFQPTTFPTPPFPEFASGHSTFSAAGAEILRLFTGSDRFGLSVTIAPGSSKVEPGLTPAIPVTLSWPTFSHAADEAGISRRYGGIHFEQGDLDARRDGRLVARRAWSTAQAYFHGTA
jgi:uncharacterized protein DUF6851/vanadium-dependent haloperoxidase-like protein